MCSRVLAGVQRSMLRLDLPLLSRGCSFAEFAQQLNINSWDGAWTDSLASEGYGGQLRVCTSVVNGQVVLSGVYSEVRSCDASALWR